MRLIRLLGATLALALVPAAAHAATPFNAGVGHDPQVAVGADGTGHVAWMTDEAGDRVGYCRVPRNGTACDAESTVLAFPGGTDANGGSNPLVFTPAANKVVVVASCWNCGAGGVTDRVYRWISTDNGATFGAPAQIATGMLLNGGGAYVDSGDVFVGLEGRGLLGMPTVGTPDPVQYAPPVFVYGGHVVRVPGSNQLVAASNDLAAVRFHVYDGTLNATSISTATNWPGSQLLPGATSSNSETSLAAGTAGVFLGYRQFVAGDNRLFLHRYNAATKTFGPGAQIQGASAIDNGVDHPEVAADQGGRVHAIWRSLHDGGRLRYTRSTNGGTTFSAPANLATHETFIDPEIAAAPDGTGFAVWQAIGTSPIRVVRLDPQPEPAAGGPAPTPTPTPGLPRPRLQLGGKAGGITARLARGKVKIKVRGRIRIPEGLTAAQACRGKVFFTVKRKKKVLAIRNARVKRTCRFSKTVTMKARKVGGARRLKVTVRFGGNDSVGVRRKSFAVKIRR